MESKETVTVQSKEGIECKWTLEEALRVPCIHEASERDSNWLQTPVPLGVSHATLVLVTNFWRLPRLTPPLDLPECVKGHGWASIKNFCVAGEHELLSTVPLDSLPSLLVDLSWLHCAFLPRNKPSTTENVGHTDKDRLFRLVALRVACIVRFEGPPKRLGVTLRFSPSETKMNPEPQISPVPGPVEKPARKKATPKKRKGAVVSDTGSDEESLTRKKKKHKRKPSTSEEEEIAGKLLAKDSDKASDSD